MLELSLNGIVSTSVAVVNQVKKERASLNPRRKKKEEKEG